MKPKKKYKTCLRGNHRNIVRTWQFFVTFLGWCKWPPTIVDQKGGFELWITWNMILAWSLSPTYITTTFNTSPVAAGLIFAGLSGIETHVRHTTTTGLARTDAIVIFNSRYPKLMDDKVLGETLLAVLALEFLGTATHRSGILNLHP